MSSFDGADLMRCIRPKVLDISRTKATDVFIEFSEGLCSTEVRAVVDAGELINAVMIVRHSSE